MKYTLLDRYYNKYIEQQKKNFLNNFNCIMKEISFKNLNNDIKMQMNNNKENFIINYENDKSIEIQFLDEKNISMIMKDNVLNKIKNDISDLEISNFIGLKIIDNCYKNTALTILYDITNDSYILLEGFLYENGFCFIKKNKIVLTYGYNDFDYIIGILSDIGDDIYEFED